MATTKITVIAKTPRQAIKYVMKNKIKNYNNEKIMPKIPFEILKKNQQQYVEFKTIVGYQNTNMLNPIKGFEEHQQRWQNKKYNNNGTRSKSGKEPLMYHVYQCFKNHEVDPDTANEIGRKLANELFGNFMAIVCTHTNTSNIHNHILISAWDMQGKKYNNCLTNTRKIRKVSDRLCKEYGLNVLEATRDLKLINYKDSKGNHHSYEPTPRKNELIKLREDKKISLDDISSYRNSDAYLISEEKKKTNRQEIQDDIDVLLVECASFEELVARLREQGYEVHDKKKNGEYLKHISYRAPLHEKATRDSSLGDGIFYLRVNLQKYLEKQYKKRNVAEVDKPEGLIQQIDYIAPEEYTPALDISKLNDEYKISIKNEKKAIEKRSDNEKLLIKDIKTSKQQQNMNVVERIQASYNALRYMETHKVYDTKSFIQNYNKIKEKQQEVMQSVNKARKLIDELENIMKLTSYRENLNIKLGKLKKQPDYNITEYAKVNIELKKCEALIEKYNLQDKVEVDKFSKRLLEFKLHQEQNEQLFNTLGQQLKEIETCIQTLDRIGNTDNAKLLINKSLQKEQSKGYEWER